MGTEIERKFLVSDPSVVEGSSGRELRQGYLSRDPARSVRVRHAGERAYLTVKGPKTGATRGEWEWEIPASDAHDLLAICEGPVLEKTRYIVEFGGRAWEVDVFAGDNAGLVTAEIEIEAEDADVELPPWIGAEVTHDSRYDNVSLARVPFNTWPD